MSTITPFVKRMRVQGGTMYTFSSATEDIGLNINERNNVVKMSHYALLNIPAISAPANLQQNKFNVLAIPGALQSFTNSGNIKDGRVLVSESFQNYALNLEANLLNRADYNPNLLNSVSERVFWKWLKETGAIRWQDSSVGYFEEETDTDSSIGYNSIVKCIGQISAGSIRTDNFGTYNETYVLVPTSYGQTRVFFKQIEDENYKHGISITNGNDKILGRENYLKPHPDALDLLAYYDMDASNGTTGGYQMQYDNSTGSWTNGWWWTAEGFSTITTNNYFIDSSSYLTSKIYNINLQYDSTIVFKRSKVDCLSVVYDLDELKGLYSDSTLTFDKMAIENAVDDTFDFNAILIYYTVYNKTLDKVLATNLLGILFLDTASGNTTAWPSIDITIPAISKIQSGPSGFGTSYSFRINIKSDNMMDDTQAVIYDESTSAQTALEDFSQVFNDLEQSVNILNQHTGTINYIVEQYNTMQNNQTQLVNQISDLQYTVNDIAQDITGTENTIAMFSAGSDPLVDSSIYMKNGKIGFFTNNPTYPVQFDVSVKVKDLIIENGIYDTSGALLLGYGSPLQIGSSTNTRSIIFYSGSGGPFMTIQDGSITFNQNVVIDGSIVTSSGDPISGGGDVTTVYVDGSLNLRDTSISYIYNTGVKPTIYVKEASLGSGLSWSGGRLYVDVSIAAGGVTQAYVDGSLATRDAAIQAETDARNTALQSFSTSASTNAAFSTRDASIIALKTADTTFATNSSVNTALNAFATNASIGIAAFMPKAGGIFTGSIDFGTYGVASTHATVYDNTTRIATDQFVQSRVGPTDTSLNTLRLRFNATEASLGNLTAVKFDASLVTITSRLNTTDTSVAFLRTYMDASFVTKEPSLNIQTGTLYTIVQTDNSKILEFSSSSAKTCYLPTNVTKFQAVILNTGTGALTIDGSTGVTLRSKNSYKRITTLYGAASAYTINGTTWTIFGDLMN